MTNSGSVLPQGSSRIEHLAAIKSVTVDAQSLEIWRKRKEAGGKQPELRIAMDTVRGGIRRGTYSTLACAKKKLYVENSYMIFGLFSEVVDIVIFHIKLE